MIKKAIHSEKIPLVITLGISGHRNDPAHDDITQVWHSLYHHFCTKQNTTELPCKSIRELKSLLIGGSEGNFGYVLEQFQWHAQKSLLKLKDQQFLDRWRLFFYTLSISAPFAAAAMVILQWEDRIFLFSSFSNWIDLAGTFFSLLLVALVTIDQLREESRIAGKYRFTCEKLQEIIRNIYFVSENKENNVAKRIYLKKQALKAHEIVMQNTYHWRDILQGKKP